MKKRYVRFVSLLVSGVLAIATAGCGGGGEADQSQGTAQATTAAGSSTSAATSTAAGEVDVTYDPLGRYEEEITITTVKVSSTSPNFPEGKSTTDNIMMDWIKNELNINVEILWETTSDEYNNKLSLSVASSDLPDMFLIQKNHYLTFRNLASNGMLADLQDAYYNYKGEYMAETVESFQGMNFEPVTVDGQLLAFTMGSLGYQHNVLWLRQDWLDTLGLELPTSMEDIKNIARQFTAQDPGGNGEGNTLGLVLSPLKPVGPAGNMYGSEPIFHMYDAYPRHWMQDDDGTVYYGSVAPEMKEGLAELAEMYAEGLIDKSFITRSSTSDVTALINGNLAGMYYDPWWDGYNTNDLGKAYPEAELVAVNAPLDDDGVYKYLSQSTSADMMCIRSGYEYPEALIKMLNLQYDIYRGINTDAAEELQPYMDAGTSITSLFATQNINLEFYNGIIKVGSLAVDYIETGSYSTDGVLLTDYDIGVIENAKAYYDNPDPINNATNWTPYHCRYVATVPLLDDRATLVPTAFYLTTESSVDYKSSLDALEDEMYLQIIVGEKPIDYFDEFVELWKNQGGDILTAEVQAIVDSR